MKGKHGMIRGAESFYRTMKLDDIKNLPIQNIAAENCALYLWATAPLLQEAKDTMRAWGFKYINIGFCCTFKIFNDPVCLCRYIFYGSDNEQILISP